MKIKACVLSCLIREAANDAPAELSREDVLLADKTSALLVQAVALLKKSSDPHLLEIKDQVAAAGNKLWSLY
jgi:hypothetical protein